MNKQEKLTHTFKTLNQVHGAKKTYKIYEQHCREYKANNRELLSDCVKNGNIEPYHDNCTDQFLRKINSGLYK